MLAFLKEWRFVEKMDGKRGLVPLTCLAKPALIGEGEEEGKEEGAGRKGSEESGRMRTASRISKRMTIEIHRSQMMDFFQKLGDLKGCFSYSFPFLGFYFLID